MKTQINFWYFCIFRSRVSLIVLLFTLFILSGCSILDKYRYYAPTADGGSLIGSLYGPKDTMRFIGDDFRISVSAQHISVETKAFGPLALPVIPGVVLGEAGERDYSNTQLFITIWVSIEPGSMAEIDLGKTKLLGNGGALVLLPASIIRYIRYDDVHREREWEEVVSQQKIEADPDDFDSVRMELYKLTYEVTAAELESFVIQIGSFIVNGKTVQIPQITFKKAGSLELLSAPGA